ncbi:MAG: phosphoglycerate kinase [Terrimesophilobacter sp.]
MLSTLDTLGPLAGKRVIVRCDLNVPLDGDTITDDGRIRASLATLAELVEAKARVIVVSHLGRPEGTPNAKYSLAPVAKRLGELLGHTVAFASDTVGQGARDVVESLGDGDIAVLENLRFNPGETAKSDTERLEFATSLAEFGDAFISDGFGVVHRKQASVCELATVLPSAAGRLIVAELAVLEKLVFTPEKPYAVVLGGSKVSDKLGVIGHLLPSVSSMLIGGGMMFTFLAALGHAVGASLLEEDQLDTVREYLAEAKRLGVNLVLPTDCVVASAFSAEAEHVIRSIDTLEDTPWGKAGIGLDIGPESAANFAAVIRDSQTVFWNGPMGVFEIPAFAEGTRTVAQALTEVSGLSVVGGGDSAAAVRALGFSDDQFGHISTGGGASLEFLEGKHLPGLEVLGWQR